jgi:hypothetical protein
MKIIKKLVERKVVDQVSGQVEGQVYGQVRGQVKRQVERQVRWQVWGHLVEQVRGIRSNPKFSTIQYNEVFNKLFHKGLDNHKAVR